MILANKVILSKVWCQRGKPGLVLTTGYSMQPVIYEGAWLVVQPCNAQAIDLGDIALILQNGNLVAHRIVLKQNRGGKAYLGHMGDNACNINIVSSQKLIGKVMRISSRKTFYLEHNYWRLINRFLGWYWAWLLRIWQWTGRRETVPEGTIFLPFPRLNRLLPKFVLHLGCWLLARNKRETRPKPLKEV